jgi:hypothetical protein
MQDMGFPFEFLGEPPTESPLYKWFEIISTGAANLGRPWTNAKGQYYKQISIYAQADFLNGLEGMSLKVMGSMGWSAEQVQAFLVGVKKDVKDTSIHCYCPM